MAMSGDFWADLAAPDPAPAPTATKAPAPKPQRPPPPYPKPLGTVAPGDAWLIFRTVQDAPEEGGGWGVENLRLAPPDHFARLRKRLAGEPRDWTHDTPLLADPAETADAAWRRFCRTWEFTSPAELAAAMRQVSRVAGLEWCAAQADRYEEATK
jgi:hypothetical protein